MPDPLAQRADVTAIQVVLNVGGQPSLYIRFADDGTVNRMGNGSVNPGAAGMYIGKSKDPLFRQFLEALPDALFTIPGRTFQVPGEQRGAACELLMQMLTRDGRVIGAGFAYGSESQGPPPDVRALVLKAVELTDHWVATSFPPPAAT